MPVRHAASPEVLILMNMSYFVFALILIYENDVTAYLH